jgi:hypothetical protein
VAEPVRFEQGPIERRRMVPRMPLSATCVTHRSIHTGSRSEPTLVNTESRISCTRSSRSESAPSVCLTIRAIFAE